MKLASEQSFVGECYACYAFFCFLASWLSSRNVASYQLVFGMYFDDFSD